MSSAELAEFREALQDVYGPFETQCPTDDAACLWRPPALVEGYKGRYLWTDGNTYSLPAPSRDLLLGS
jgi:hypothetical protein